MQIPRFAVRSAIPAMAIALLSLSPVSASAGDEPTAGSGAAPTSAAAPGTSAGAPPSEAGVVEWAIEPSSPAGPTGRDYFVIQAAPGDEVIDWVGISNFGDAPLTLKVYATDAVLTDDNNFSLLPAADQPLDVGSWIGFDVKDITVEPGQRADVPFKMTVPENATPGDHQGGIVASVSTPGVDNGEGGTVTVDRRVAARMYLRIDGPLNPVLNISDVRMNFVPGSNPFGPGTADVSYTLTNNGNVRLSGTTTAEVSAWFGWFGKNSVSPEFPPLAPGETRVMSQQVSGVFASGPLTADLTVRPIVSPDPGGPAPAPLTADAQRWAVGLLFWIAVGLIALILLTVVYRVIRRRRRRAAAATAAAATAPAAGSAEATATGDVLVPSHAGATHDSAGPDDRA